MQRISAGFAQRGRRRVGNNMSQDNFLKERLPCCLLGAREIVPAFVVVLLYGQSAGVSCPMLTVVLSNRKLASILLLW